MPPVPLALPDPFLLNSGQRLRTKEDWDTRRKEIKDRVASYAFGHMPPAPATVQGRLLQETAVCGHAAVRQTLELQIGDDNPLLMQLLLTVPQGDRSYPVIVRNWRAQRPGRASSATPGGIVERVVQRGYALSEYRATDLQPDATSQPGPARRAYPVYDWATIAVWAWGGMRVIDYLLTLPVIDARRIIVTGHSRGGKTALLTGAFDERVTVTVPNGCGGGGFQCWRHPMVPGDPDGVARHESIAVMSRARPYWFHRVLADYVDDVAAYPVDQHDLAALVAPRALCAVECMDDACATPLAAQRTYLAARQVYAWMGASDRLGIRFRPDGGHGQFAPDWEALLDFCDRELYGKQSAHGYRFDRIPYPEAYPGFDWQAPAGA